MQWHKANPTSHWNYVTDTESGGIVGETQWNMFEKNCRSDLQGSVFNVGSPLERSRVVCLEENDHCSLEVSPFPATRLSDS